MATALNLAPTKRARIMVADDHSLVAAGLARLLEDEFEMVGIVADGRSLLEQARTQQPDLILLDVSMPLLNGLDAARHLKFALPNAKLVFVTVHLDSPYVVSALRAGASAYVSKRSTPSELVAAIRQVLSGNRYITPLIHQGTLEGLLKVAETSRPLLSARQREVLQLVAEGHTAKEIAVILRISPKTVEFHKGWIMKKLDLHSTAELTRYAIEHKIASSRNEC